MPKIVNGLTAQLTKAWIPQSIYVAAEKEVVDSQPVLPKLVSFDHWPVRVELFLSLMPKLQKFQENQQVVGLARSVHYDYINW
jgi:hypothetical protein